MASATRNIVVTGGGTGIGRAVAAAFAAAGDSLTITGRRREPLEAAAAELGPNVRAAVCDGADPQHVAAFATHFAAGPAGGGVGVLVNNAGGNTDFDRGTAGGLAALAANWRANLDANLISAVLMTEALEDRLADGGTVVSIGSIAADKGAASYGAAKAALASWNVDLARRIGQRGATANVVAPGYIADTGFFRGRLTDERRGELVGATFTQRAGVPGDIAATVHFLASPGARHITGQVLSVNGGEQTTR